MKKFMHTAISIITLSLIAVTPVFADDGSSATYTTPLLPNVTDYHVDGNVTLDVNVAAVNALEITLSTSNLVIDLTPGMNTAAFDHDVLNILVGTSNPTGYTLTMAPSYNSASTTSLTRIESINNVTPTIETISNTITPATFASTSDTDSINKWGYQLTATNLDIDRTLYNPVLATNIINSSTASISNDPTSISFGAKANTELPAGDYRVTLQFIVVTNAIPYLQNLASAECTTTPSIYYDSRDMQAYMIQRLEDGRCWMMENLNLGANTIYNDLDSTNTNIVSGRTILASEFNRWKVVNGTTPSYTEPMFIPITSANSSNGLVEDSYGNKYATSYNYCAASAGTLCTDTPFSPAQNIQYDICPAGWRMPIIVADNSMNEGIILGQAYGIPYHTTDDTASVILMQQTLKIPLAGSIHGSTGLLINQGSYGGIWTNMVSNISGARLVMQTPGYITLGTNADRRGGNSVRCVVK